MKRLKWVKHFPNKDRLLAGSVVLVVAFSWTWLFTSRVSELAESLIVGYLLALLAFVVIVSITSIVFIKTITFFIRTFTDNKAPAYWTLPLLYVVWAAVEYLVSLCATIVWFGKNGSLDSVLPFASFSPILAHTPLVYLSRFVGFYGLSAVVVVFLTVILVKKLRKYALTTFVLILVATICAWIMYRAPSGKPVDALIVAEKLSEPTDIPQNKRKLIVFPEYGLSNATNGTDRVLVYENSDVFYVGSKQTPLEDGHKNVLVFGSANLGVLQQRAKSRLIPGGEYLPAVAQVILTITQASKTIDYFNAIKAVQKGPANYSTLDVDTDLKLGSAVCASIISPEDYRRFTKNGATVLTNSASLGIFNSDIFTFQHQGLAKFMSTANARPFLQSSNDGAAFAIDHNGRMLIQIDPVNTKEVKVISNTKQTPYTILGDWPVYIGLVAIVAMLLRKFVSFSKGTTHKE